MRKSPPLLSSLFNPTTVSVLGATILRPSKEWYLSDLASHLRVRPSTLQRTLLKFSRAGILLSAKTETGFIIAQIPPARFSQELAAILTKTSGIAEPLREALIPFAREIILAFVHGSIAEARERSESDIDVIIVGGVSNSDLAIALRPVQEKLGREINTTRYTAGEFATKVAGGHHFLSSVLKKPKIFLIGSERELEEIAGRQSGGARAHEQAGTRRAP